MEKYHTSYWIIFFCNFSSCSRQIIEPIIREIMTKYPFSLKLEKRKKTNISIVIYFLRCFFRQSEQGRIFVKIKFFRFYFFSTKNGDRFFVFFLQKISAKINYTPMIFDMQKNTKNGLETPTGRTPQNSTGNIDFHHFFSWFFMYWKFVKLASKHRNW